MGHTLSPTTPADDLRIRILTYLAKAPARQATANGILTALKIPAQQAMPAWYPDWVRQFMTFLSKPSVPSLYDALIELEDDRYLISNFENQASADYRAQVRDQTIETRVPRRVYYRLDDNGQALLDQLRAR